MIEKTELLKLATSLKTPLSTVEKDYILGWFIAAIQNNSELSDNWVFKGGTCIKKCYLYDYRFSEDLDFTLLDSSQLNENFLKQSLITLSSWLYEEINLAIPFDEVRVDIYKNKRGNNCAQASVRFCGPLHPKSKACWPKVKFDLTSDEKIVKAPEKRNVFHPYSDKPISGIYVNAYPIEEVFAEKLRALTERCRPRDLYDVIMLFQNKVFLKLSAKKCLRIIKEKCHYKSIDIPTFAILENHSQKAILVSQWFNMLQHQVANLPSWNIFWKELPNVFKWLKNN